MYREDLRRIYWRCSVICGGGREKRVLAPDSGDGYRVIDEEGAGDIGGEAALKSGHTKLYA